MTSDTSPTRIILPGALEQHLLSSQSLERLGAGEERRWDSSKMPQNTISTSHPTNHKSQHKNTHGIGIGEFVGKPSDKSPLIVAGVVNAGGLLIVFVTCE